MMVTGVLLIEGSLIVSNTALTFSHRECGVCAINVNGEIDHRDVFFSDRQRASGARTCPRV